MAVNVCVSIVTTLFSILCGIFFIGNSNRFGEHACEDVRAHLNYSLVGQPMAVKYVSDAVCTHLAYLAYRGASPKPLVLSLNGWTGTGKSYTHLLMAQALYRRKPARSGNKACTSHNRPNWWQSTSAWCPAYHIIQGLEFKGGADGVEQMRLLKEAVLAHLRLYPDALVVFENYDKMGCTVRQTFLDLVTSVKDAALTAHAIFVLESNVGYEALNEFTMHKDFESDMVSVDGAAPAWLLKKMEDAVMIAACTLDSNCPMSRVDLHRLCDLPTLRAPYFRVERKYIEVLIKRRLSDWDENLKSTGPYRRLDWEDDVVHWLAGALTYTLPDGNYNLSDSGTKSHCVTTVKDVERIVMGIYVIPVVQKWVLDNKVKNAGVLCRLFVDRARTGKKSGELRAASVNVDEDWHEQDL